MYSGTFINGIPEEYQRHEMCRLFGWTADEYEQAPAEMTDWAFAIEASKAHVAEIMREQARG